MKRVQVVRGYGGVSAADRRTERRGQAARRRTPDLGRIRDHRGDRAGRLQKKKTAAGLTSRYFYEQFESRDALLFAISDDVRDQLLTALVNAGVGDPGTLSDKLRSALTAFLDIIAADPTSTASPPAT